MFGKQNFFLKGSDCFLECCFKNNNSKNIALILHPHPLHGGTMHNKVIFQVYKTFSSLSFDVLRYNSRGVEKSEGEFSNGEKEILDAIEILKLLLKNYETVSLIGFSFGSYVAWNAMHEINSLAKEKIHNTILIAPPSNLYQFYDYSKYSNTLIIQGSSDVIVPKHYTDEFVSQLMNPVTYKTIENSDHFFTNQLDEIDLCIQQFIDLNSE